VKEDVVVVNSTGSTQEVGYVIITAAALDDYENSQKKAEPTNNNNRAHWTHNTYQIANPTRAQSDTAFAFSVAVSEHRTTGLFRIDKATIINVSLRNDNAVICNVMFINK